MNTEQTATPKTCRSGKFISICLAAGAAIGAAFGAATHDMAASVAWGIAAGAMVGSILTFTRKKCD